MSSSSSDEGYSGSGSLETGRLEEALEAGSEAETGERSGSPQPARESRSTQLIIKTAVR